MAKLLIIHGTTRPSRTGIQVSRAFEDLARSATNFEVELVDLKELALPFLDEVDHPRLGNYQLEHTQKWAKIVSSGDAIVWATAQYNGSFPAPLKNAVDFLSAEWRNKPLGLISWGGKSGGIDAARALKPVAAVQQMPVIGEVVDYPMYYEDFDDEGILHVSEQWTKKATALLKELEAAVN